MKDELLKHIAFIFYAVAKSDKTLSFEEYVKLSEVLKKSWSHIGNTELIKAQFIILQRENKLASYAFNKFIEFLHKHPQQFNKDLNSLILKSANDIAYAFAKINKSELNYMVQLSLEFKKLDR